MKDVFEFDQGSCLQSVRRFEKLGGISGNTRHSRGSLDFDLWKVNV